MSSNFTNLKLVVPRSLEFPEPEALAPTLTQVKLRTPAITALQPTAAPGSEIRVEIPELSQCFLDPSTSTVCFTVELTGSLDNSSLSSTTFSPQSASRGANPTEVGIFGDSIFYTALLPWKPKRPPSARNVAYLLGGGWSFFKRYQLHCNANVLVDDIEKPGVLNHHLSMYTGGLNYHYGNWHAGRYVLRADDHGSSITTVLVNANDNISLLARKYDTVEGTDAYGTSSNLARDLIFGKRWQSKRDNTNKLPFDTTEDVALDRLDSGKQSSKSTSTVSAENSANSSLLNFLEIQLPANCIQIYNGSNVKSTTVTAANSDKKLYSTTSGESYSITAKSDLKWSYVQNISLNLIGLIGANNPEQLLPMFVGPYRLTFIINDYENFFYSGTTTMTLDNLKFLQFEFVGNYIRIDNGETLGRIFERLPTQGQIAVKTTGYTYNSVYTNQGSSGMNEYPVGARKGAVKMFIIAWQPQQSSNAVEGQGIGKPIEGELASVNPALTSQTSMVINGKFYPETGLDPLLKPADTYNNNLECMGMNLDATHKPILTPQQWLTCVANPGNLFTRLNQQLSSNPGILHLWKPYIAHYLGSNEKYPVYLGGGPDFCFLDDVEAATGEINIHNTSPRLLKERLTGFNLFINTERMAKKEYVSGTSTMTGSTFFKANHQENLPCPGVFHIYTHFDAVVIFDLIAKQVFIRQ